MINKQTNEKIMEVFVDCVKSALVSGQEHLVNCKKFNDYLDSITIPEQEYVQGRGVGVKANSCPDCDSNFIANRCLICGMQWMDIDEDNEIPYHTEWQNFDSEPE